MVKWYLRKQLLAAAGYSQWNVPQVLLFPLADEDLGDGPEEEGPASEDRRMVTLEGEKRTVLVHGMPSLSLLRYPPACWRADTRPTRWRCRWDAGAWRNVCDHCLPAVRGVTHLFQEPVCITKSILSEAITILKQWKQPGSLLAAADTSLTTMSRGLTRGAPRHRKDGHLLWSLNFRERMWCTWRNLSRNTPGRIRERGRNIHTGSDISVTCSVIDQKRASWAYKRRSFEQ